MYPHKQIYCLLEFFLALGVVTNVVVSQELGDFDGDGRLTIRDTKFIQGGGIPVPGSIKFDTYGCSIPITASDNNYYYLQGLTFLEVVRRGSLQGLPLWIDFWPKRSSAPVLPLDPRIRIAVEDITVDGNNGDLVNLQIAVETAVPIEAFMLIIESDDNIVRVPFLWASELARSIWQMEDWLEPAYVFGEFNQHALGDLTVHTSCQNYLASGGNLVVMYGMVTWQETISPGSYTVIVQARLPIGASPARYALRCLSSSQILLADGDVVAPEIRESGSMTLTHPIASGWDEGAPPLQVDGVLKEVVGSIEFRITDQAEMPPVAAEEPIVEADPGDIVVLKVQMKTEVPLNEISIGLQLGQGALCVDPAPTFEFINPEDGVSYTPRRSFYCYAGNPGLARADFQIGGSLTGLPTASWNPYPDRVLEYFKPMREWTSIFSVRLQIAENMGGGDTIPLRILVGDNDEYPCDFVPYGMMWPFCPRGQPPQNNWSYNIIRHGAFLKVRGDSAPDCPDLLGLQLSLGRTEGYPGEIVDIPVVAQVEQPTSVIHLVAGYDSSKILVTGFEILVRQGVSGEITKEHISRGQRRLFCEAQVPLGCAPGVPVVVNFLDISPSVVYIQIVTGSLEYPAASANEIGALKVLILDRSMVGEVPVIHSTAIWHNPEAGEDQTVQSGGEPAPPSAVTFSCPRKVEDGLVKIQNPSFRRGDSNGDGKVDLADVIGMLSYLFQGNRRAESCLDSSDADDNGAVQISDAVFTLGFLFLGRVQVPSPFEVCGLDLTEDELTCREKNCL